MKKFIIGLIVCAMFFGMTVFAVKGENMTEYVNKNPEITGMLYVDENGYLSDGTKEVVLNGVNIGNWLICEIWMSPILDPGEKMANSDVISVLTDRFGKKSADEIMNGYMDNYMTEKDFENIEKLGFNCVRIPFWYRNFMNGGGRWLTDTHDTNPGIKRLDFALEMCKKYNLYAVLDMHGCPGGQSMNHSTGIIGRNELYESIDNINAMKTLWTAIARRYKDNIYVAAYDIMNEPQNNSGFDGNRAWKPESEDAVSRTNKIYSEVTDAIRAVDERHIITIEGVWHTSVLPKPDELKWDNMMYQLHIYDSTVNDISLQLFSLIWLREQYSTAIYVGEYNCRENEEFGATVLEKNHISRTKWNYKTVNADYDGWGLFNKNTTRVDLRNASLAEIKAAMIDGVNSENGFEFNVEEYNKISR